MITWLASYPRSGNSFFRILLHRLLGLPTYTAYSTTGAAERFPDDTARMCQWVGQTELECDVDALLADSGMHFVKTHDLAREDNCPAIVLVRDGRDAVVSYAHFVLKTEQGVDRPGKDLFEATLREIITGDAFGGWSANVNGWIDRVGPGRAIHYEDLLKDPTNIAVAALRRLGFNGKIDGAVIPSFQELQASIPWFFRKGTSGYWHKEMPRHLQDLFLERHGDTLRRLGYAEQMTLVPRTTTVDFASAGCE